MRATMRRPKGRWTGTDVLTRSQGVLEYHFMHELEIQLSGEQADGRDALERGRWGRLIVLTALLLAGLEIRTTRANTVHPLASGPFAQDWTNASLITVNDDWSSVPAIVGYLGDDAATSTTGVDPQTLLSDFVTSAVDINANVASPSGFASGGLAEFDTLPNPTVGLQGSGTADHPFLLIQLDTQGVFSVKVRYTLRDLDNNADNAAQQVALHYRVGNSGDFTNVPSAYVADATTGPFTAGPDIPVNITLPPAADNQSLVQLRIMTTNAVGTDELVGIDDIMIAGGDGNPNEAPVNLMPQSQTTAQGQTLFLSSGTSNAIQVSDPDVGAGSMKITIQATTGTLTLGSTGGLTFTLGDGTQDMQMTFVGTLSDINAALDNSSYAPAMGFTGQATITITSDDQGNTGGPAKMDTDALIVQVVQLYHVLANGSLTQNWSNTALVTTDNKWDIVPSIRGYRGDGLATLGDDPQSVLADGSATPLSVLANQTNPDPVFLGGLAEFDTLPNPVVALQGSATADAPHIVIHVNSTGITGVRLKFNAVDVDGSADNAVQAIAVQWRVGSASFMNVPAGFIADATAPNATGKTTAVDVVLPGGATNQPDLQIRIITADAIGNDEWVGIDDIEVLQVGFAVLGSGLAGVNGVPSLAGSGTLAAGSAGSLALTSAKPSSLALLFLSLASVPAPFKGGTLLTVPVLLTVNLATNASGALTLPFVWPSGVPSAASIYFQYAIQDAAAIKGVALSNALRGVTP